MSLISIEENIQEIFALMDEYLVWGYYLSFSEEQVRVHTIKHPVFENKKRKYIKTFDRELTFQLAVLRWASLIFEHGKGEVLRRIKEATPTGQNPPKREMRAFAIASKYFIQADRLSL